MCSRENRLAAPGGEIVEVRHMAVQDACEHDMLLQIHWQGREVAIPLSQLDAIGAGRINPGSDRRLPLLSRAGGVFSEGEQISQRIYRAHYAKATRTIAGQPDSPN
jgi:hypothetical protein